MEYYEMIRHTRQTYSNGSTVVQRYTMYSHRRRGRIGMVHCKDWSETRVLNVRFSLPIGNEEDDER